MAVGNSHNKKAISVNVLLFGVFKGGTSVT